MAYRLINEDAVIGLIDLKVAALESKIDPNRPATSDSLNKRAISALGALRASLKFIETAK